MYNKKHCSPVSNKNDNKISCLNERLIKKIAKILDIKTDTSLKVIHKNISDKIKEISECETEYCWFTIDKIINKLNSKELNEIKELYKPVLPKKWLSNPREWLNTLDIEKVLNQYAKANKDFYFYGAMPSDYDNTEVCDIYKLCKINIKNHIKNGIKKIGIVFNTDENDEPGEHWVCIYIDLIGKNSGYPSIYFFDSVGKPPQKNIQKAIESIRKQKKLNYYFNDIKHQKKNTECGVYCIHFLTSMINGTKFRKYIKNIKNDDYMYKYRYFFFNKI